MQKPPKNATKHSITDAQTNRRTDQPTKRIIESYTRNLRQTLVCDIRRKVIVDENKWISFFFSLQKLTTWKQDRYENLVGSFVFLCLFLVACYATLHPALSVRPSVRQSVRPLVAVCETHASYGDRPCFFCIDSFFFVANS